MNLFNVEDTLEEFDTRYMESYDQVNRNHPHSADSDKSNRVSMSTKNEKLSLSSPLLDDKKTASFPTTFTQEVGLFNDEDYSVSPRTKPKSTTTHGSFATTKPPLKPSVTIATINTIAELQRMKSKHLPSARSPTCYRGSKTNRRSTLPATSSCIGNPFYKPAARVTKSASSIPTRSSYNLNLQSTPPTTLHSTLHPSYTKKRKVSSKPELQISSGSNKGRSGTLCSDASLSSFDSILTIEPDHIDHLNGLDQFSGLDQFDQFNQLDKFNFDYFLSKEPEEFFNDYTDSFN